MSSDDSSHPCPTLAIMVGRLFSALGEPRTYLPHRNPLAALGFLWGIPVPVATLGVHLVATGTGVSASALANVVRDNPIQWLFLLHPLLFAVVFGAAGTLLERRDAQIRDLIEALRLRADTDGLTGLMNHRAFHERLREEAARAQRGETPVSLLLADLDHFKQLNDTHGHPAGDAVLRELSARLTGHVRGYDVVARYGGEEFAIILPGDDLVASIDAAKRLNAAVSAMPFEPLRGLYIPVTVSIGAAALQPNEPIEAWVTRADGALYSAKRAGRDRVHPTPELTADNGAESGLMEASPDGPGATP